MPCAALLALLALAPAASAWKMPQTPVNIVDGPFLEETPHCLPEELQRILLDLGHADAAVDLREHKVTFSFTDTDAEAGSPPVPVYVYLRRETLSITAHYRTTLHALADVAHVADAVVANCTQRASEWSEAMLMSSAHCTARHLAEGNQLALVETLQSDLLLPATMYTSRKETNAEEHFRLVKRWLEYFSFSLQQYSAFRHKGTPFAAPLALPDALKRRRVGEALHWLPNWVVERPALALAAAAAVAAAPWALVCAQARRGSIKSN
jgi:hypothetical protein